MSGWAWLVAVVFAIGAFVLFVVTGVWSLLAVVGPYIVIVGVTAFLAFLVTNSAQRVKPIAGVLLGLGTSVYALAIALNHTAYMTSAVLYWASIPLWLGAFTVATVCRAGAED